MNDKMETGEKELREAFEQTTTRNVKAVVDHSNETRRLIRQLEENIKRFQNIVLNRERDIELLKKQLANVQTIVFSKGTVNGNLG